MRSLVIVALVLVALLALTLLPTGYAQPLPPGGTGVYLPLVFRPFEATRTATPTRTSTSPAATPSRTSTPSATQSIPTATAGSENGFPASPPGVPTRTVIVPPKPIFTNGQDLWNCGDFGNRADAEFVFEANKPGDPNRLDQNNDGSPCDSLR